MEKINTDYKRRTWKIYDKPFEDAHASSDLVR